MAEKYNITKKEEVYTLLKDKRNFEYMSEPLLRKLIDVMKVARFREEKTLIRQGAKHAFFYIIIKGCVSVFVDGKFLYHLRRTGDVFGELSFVSQRISTATIKAEKDLGVIAISYDFLNKLQNIELCLWLARVIGEKLIRTSKIKSGLTPEETLATNGEGTSGIPDLLTDETEESGSATNGDEVADSEFSEVFDDLSQEPK